jgi:hypothetical protein
MNDETKKDQAGPKLTMMGERYRSGQVKEKPIGDKMINAVRDAIWEAWEIGLDNAGHRVYPSIPLLDRQAVEPEQPEM